MLKIKDLLTKEKCSQKSYFNTQELSSYKNKNYSISTLLKNLWKVDFFNLDVDDFINNNLKEDIFFNKKEYEVELELLKAQVGRFIDYLKSCSYSYLGNNVTHVTVNGEIVKVSIDLILKHTNQITGETSIIVSNIKRKSPDLKYAGQKDDTKADRSIELYLLEEAGKQLYPGENIIANIFYLKNVDDKDNLLSEFENKKGRNVISTSNVVMNVTNIEDRLKSIIEDKDVKKCNSGDCDMCEYNKICNYSHIDYSSLSLIPPKAKSSNVLFTPNQERVIDHEYGNVRINAVAGSGKTTVLVNRVLKLLEKGYRPMDFLLITFTEKGCLEIKEKLDYWINQYNIPNLTSNDFRITTFNGFGYDMIKDNYQDLGFIKEPMLIDNIERLEIIDNIITNMPNIQGMNYTNPLMNFYNAKGVLVELSSLIEFIKTNGIVYPEELASAKNIDILKAEQIMTVYLKYKDELVMRGYIDYQDMIDYTILLLEDEEIINKYGVRHLMIDEFQDTDSTQLYIVKKLSLYKHMVSILICGDCSQSIYGFRGTTPLNILNFDKEFDNVEDIPLNENFRSTKQICALADYIKDLNKIKINSKMISKRDGDIPMVFKIGVVSNIIYLIDKGVELSDICVIARTKAELLDINEELAKEGIPSVLAVSEQYIDNQNVKNIFGYAKFLLNNSLDLHFAEYLQMVKYKEFNENMDNLKPFIEKEKKIFLDDFMNLSKEKDKIEFFYNSLSVVEKDKTTKYFLNFLKSKSFYRLKDLLNYLIKMEKYQSDGGVKDNENYNAITLTTAHASKGREFDCVLLMIDGFKSKIKNDEELEAERRLLYVAISRAKKELYIMDEGRVNKNSLLSEICEGILKIS